MATNLIEAGLARRERERNGTKLESLETFIGAPTNYSALNSLWSDLDLKAKRLKDMIAGINTAIDKYRASEDAKLETAIPNKVARAETVGRLVAAERKRLLTVGEFDRLELLRAIRTAGAKVAAAKSDLTDAVVLMDRSNSCISEAWRLSSRSVCGWPAPVGGRDTRGHRHRRG